MSPKSAGTGLLRNKRERRGFLIGVSRAVNRVARRLRRELYSWAGPGY